MHAQVLSTARKTLARAAAASSPARAGSTSSSPPTGHAGCCALLADCGVSRRCGARQGTRHAAARQARPARRVSGGHGGQGRANTAVLTAEDKEGKTAGRARHSEHLRCRDRRSRDLRCRDIRARSPRPGSPLRNLRSRYGGGRDLWSHRDLVIASRRQQHRDRLPWRCVTASFPRRRAGRWGARRPDAARSSLMAVGRRRRNHSRSPPRACRQAAAVPRRRRSQDRSVCSAQASTRPASCPPRLWRGWADAWDNPLALPRGRRSDESLLSGWATLIDDCLNQ